MKASTVAFTLAAACLGAGLFWIETGVRAIVAEQADAAWEKVSDKPDAVKADGV